MVNRHPDGFVWHMQDVIANIRKLADKTRFPKLQSLVVVLDITKEIMGPEWSSAHRVGVSSLIHCLRALSLHSCGIVQHDTLTRYGRWEPADEEWSIEARDRSEDNIAQWLEEGPGLCWLSPSVTGLV